MPEASAGGADRALYVLSTLAQTARPVSLDELAERTSLPADVLRRQIQLLMRWGFVLEHEGCYVPGPQSLQLAWGFGEDSFLIRQARSDIEKLAASTGERVGLIAVVRNQMVCLDMVEGATRLRHTLTKGRSAPLLQGASAKSLLAFMSEQRRQAVLAEMTPHWNAAELGALADELTAVRLSGYAVSNGELDVGIWGVSVPVFRRSMQAVATLTLMTDSVRGERRAQALIASTVAAAHAISERLQCH